MIDIFKAHKIPASLLAFYLFVLAWSGYNPVDYDVWVVEAITSAIPALILGILYFYKIRFTTLGYILAFILPVMHAIGAHYTFANVPFEWFNHLINSDRNMYDRVAHASVGLYAFVIIEGMIKYNIVNRRWAAYSYAIFFIMALAAAYELFEWQYAVSVNPEAGIEVLGSQGDIWDAQKDMLMDTLGAITGAIIFFFSRFKKS